MLYYAPVARDKAIRGVSHDLASKPKGVKKMNKTHRDIARTIAFEERTVSLSKAILEGIAFFAVFAFAVTALAVM